MAHDASAPATKEDIATLRTDLIAHADGLMFDLENRIMLYLESARQNSPLPLPNPW